MAQRHQRGVSQLPSKASVWREVERQHLHINEVDFVDGRRLPTWPHYMKHELGEQTESVSPKSHTTIGAYKRVLRNRLLPRLGRSHSPQY